MPAKTPKQAVPAPAPVVEAKPTKKAPAAKAEPVVEAAPAPAPAPAPVAVAPKQKGGKAAPKVEAAVVAPAPVVEAAAPKKVAKKAVAAAPAAAAPKQKGGAKAAGAKKAAAKPAAKPAKVAKKVVEEDGEEGEKGVRSFKVKLPGTEEFTGRFTGLTPYQAANKALSKYFRENKAAKSEITFSIVESTRGSKRSTYTYNGKREKLTAPVKYSIKGNDGAVREIVKEYKNKLTKVKKAETKVASA